MNWLEPWMYLVPVVALLVLAGVWWAARFSRTIHLERARELFRLQRERLLEQFLDAARKLGKPRGVHWAGCESAGEFELARDRATRQLVALVPVAIRFEAIPGSDMENVPAVDQMKTASAVFAFERGHWITSGQAIQNLEPKDALRHFAQQYETVPAGH